MVGREISDLEREVLALPIRYGGLGIQNPVKTSDREYHASDCITHELQDLIIAQDSVISKLDRTKMDASKKLNKTLKEARLKSDFTRLKSQLPESQERALDQASSKGASSWLSALPLQALGYSLNKAEFRDSICLRYNWRIQNVHNFCACGAKNDIDHALVCKKGGYVTFRHNALRDAEAELLREVSRDVRTEPLLLPTDKNSHPPGTNVQDKAPSDIVATGLWGTFERTYFDVRVTHAGAKSNSGIPLEKLLTKNELEKKRKYNSRVIHTEKSSFVPLVYSTAGSTGPECEKHHRRVADLISRKRNEKYGHIMNHIRTRIRFSLLKSVLISIRGIRGKDYKRTTPISFVPFNLIPQEDAYECP